MWWFLLSSDVCLPWTLWRMQARIAGMQNVNHHILHRSALVIRPTTLP